MLLSDAIRLGSMLKPQGFGDESANPDAEETCALGAAAAAAGVDYASRYAHWYHMGYDDNVIRGVWERNDGVGFGRREWTREEIADWVEQWEREHGMRPAAPESGSTEKHGTPVTAGDVKAFALGLFEDALEEEEREA